MTQTVAIECVAHIGIRVRDLDHALTILPNFGIYIVAPGGGLRRSDYPQPARRRNQPHL